MKKFIISLLTLGCFILTGCLESTQEITLKDDGSGIVSNTNDMSALIGLAKQMGGGAEMEKAAGQVIDSTISMQKGADSIPNLTPEEREMARSGTLKFNMDLSKEKFITSLIFPFKSPDQIPAFNKLSGKMMAETMKNQLGGGMPGGGEMPELSSFDDYYTMEFSNGELKKKLNKEKYAGVESDEYLKGMKESSAMGLAMKANYIINLPRPAKVIEGKGAKLSEDKMKVMLTSSIDDFFEDPSLLEFKIKY